MPCFCQFFSKGKQYRSVKKDTVSFNSEDEHTGRLSSSKSSQNSPVSASELVQLKAEVWSLRNSLTDCTAVNGRMQDAITQTVAEKYELLDELHQARHELGLAEEGRRDERNVHCRERDQLLQEIASYRAKINELSFLVDKIAEQNIQLKQSLLEANDTVCKVAKKYLKLKSLGSSEGSWEKY